MDEIAGEIVPCNTPRTDAAAFDAHPGGPQVVMVEFAAELESENAALREALGAAIKKREGPGVQIDLIVEECANGSVVFAIKEALIKQGFSVQDCGFGIGEMAGEGHLICRAPIDFVDCVPDEVLAAMGGGPGGATH